MAQQYAALREQSLTAQAFLTTAQPAPCSGEPAPVTPSRNRVYYAGAPGKPAESRRRARKRSGCRKRHRPSADTPAAPNPCATADRANNPPPPRCTAGGRQDSPPAHRRRPCTTGGGVDAAPHQLSGKNSPATEPGSTNSVTNSTPAAHPQGRRAPARALFENQPFLERHPRPATTATDGPITPPRRNSALH